MSDLGVLKHCEHDNAPDVCPACELELLTERYAAVRRAYGIEAQERGRLEAQLAAAVDLLRDVAVSGVESDYLGVGYVTVQIDRATWDDLAAYRGSGDSPA